ncbi:MAG: cell wall hydrolase [Eubacteriales bacterium]|nr:cell wall hydrolase [Eubacteriales bacterium]
MKRFSGKRPCEFHTAPLRSLALLLALSAALAFAPVSGLILPVTASKETQEKIDQARQEKEQTEDAIEQNEAQIDQLNDTRDSLQGELSNLNSELSAISANLADLEQQIADKNEEIETTQVELESAQATADEQYEQMKLRIRFMYEKSRTVYLEAFLSAGTFAELLNRSNYIESLSAYDRRKLEEYIATRDEIDEKKAQLEREQSELDTLRASAVAEQSRVSGLVSSTAGSISAYSGQIENAEATADQLQEQLDAKNSEISALEAQLAEERRLEALSAASVWRDISQVTFAEGDRYLLANLIYCEAGNQPYEGQVAVGAVVINRVLSGAFPDTIVGVIYQTNQFEPVSTGRLALALARDDATEACYRAADAAMAGQSTVADCIFFRTPIPQVTPRYTIGGHIFY